MVVNLAAARLAAWAWHADGVLGIDRKRAAACEVRLWRPDPTRAGRYGVVKRRWSAAEDAIVLSQSLEDAAASLGRTVSSVSTRRWRLTRTTTPFA